MSNKSALGKGVDALLSTGDISFLNREESPDERRTVDLSIELIRPDPDQPRKQFNEESIEELANSIRQCGIIQPILVEEREGLYYIIAGERRYRASKKAELKSLPAIICHFSEEEKFEIALIENLQREDLNPLEEAMGYRRLIEKFDLTQQDVAQKIGKNRATVANALRLLKLPTEAREALSEGAITAGHARTILSIVNPANQQILFEKIVNQDLSVREAESAASLLNRGIRSDRKESGKEREPELKEPHLTAFEQKLIDCLGTKVAIKGDLKRGRIEISYYSGDDLERIGELLKGVEKESPSDRHKGEA